VNRRARLLATLGLLLMLASLALLIVSLAPNPIQRDRFSVTAIAPTATR
jgi:hypothetical protein